MKSTVIASAILSAIGVSAHGFVSSAVLDGTEYPGYDPYQGEQISITHMVSFLVRLTHTK